MKYWNRYLVQRVLGRIIAQTPQIHAKTLNKGENGRWWVYIDAMNGKPKGFLRFVFGDNFFTISINKEEFPAILYKDIEKLFGYSLEEAMSLRVFGYPIKEEKR